ncbi:MAG: hypothetical protein SCH71_12300 [Desulfobulbaceae bacterium]|nr:hypothetical protein [Desulfobulbaceae bacterium]
MNKNTESLDLTFSANGVSAAGRQKDTSGTYAIYYITRRRGVNSPRVLLLPKTGFLSYGPWNSSFPAPGEDSE